MELNLPPTYVALDPDQDPVVRHLGPKNFNKCNLNGVPYYLFPDRSAPMFQNAAAGTLLSSFASGLVLPWGVGVDLAANTVWVGNLGAGGGDDLDYEFTRAGALNRWFHGYIEPGSVPGRVIWLTIQPLVPSGR